MKSETDYRICSRCVMDTSSKNISFDHNGVCSHCQLFDSKIRPFILTAEEKSLGMKNLIEKIRISGKGRKYDCLIGLSGGMDSSYVVYLAYKFNLRAVILHFDNGWDSELAVKNIHNIIQKTGYPYLNYIVDWEEFKDIQRSYFKASVVDVEVPTDMGILSLIPKVSLQFNVPYILFGQNIETESTMGNGWNYDKMDRSNLEDIHRIFGTIKLKTFPYLSPFSMIMFKLKRIRWANILDYDVCNYLKIKKILNEEFGWRDYGVKHGESIFTKFYQSYYLTKKFGFDKRRAHLCDQINSGHLSRFEAIRILSQPLYSNSVEEQNELNYVISKLDFTRKEFDDIMNLPSRSHFDFQNRGLYGSFFDKLLLRAMHIRRLFRSRI